MLVQKSTIRALRKLCCYKRVLQGHWRGCVGTAEYYSTIGALGMLCRYRRVLLAHSEGCGGTKEYSRRTGAAVLVQHCRNTVDA